MIGLDTNVVIRYLAQDDAKQSALATRFVEKTLTADEPGYLSLVVLVEIAWVLTSNYGADRKKLVEVIEGLLTTQQLEVQSAELVWKAVRRFASSRANFSDALVLELAIARGCTRTLTFDKAAATSAGFDLLV